MELGPVVLLKRARIENVRIHNLRHSFADGRLWVGEGSSLIGTLLGHNKTQTTARYIYLANHPPKAAANRIANRIADKSDYGRHDLLTALPLA